MVKTYPLPNGEQGTLLGDIAGLPSYQPSFTCKGTFSDYRHQKSEWEAKLKAEAVEGFLTAWADGRFRVWGKIGPTGQDEPIDCDRASYYSFNLEDSSAKPRQAYSDLPVLYALKVEGLPTTANSSRPTDKAPLPVPNNDRCAARKVGRPSVKDIVMGIYQQRRNKGTPLGATQISEARAILVDWPKKGTATPPKEKTVSERISSRYRSDKFSDKFSDKL